MNTIAKVLYVDDEPINLELFEINFLGKFNILTAENGYSGLELLKTDPTINVVVSDMKMPQMNGMEFIRTAKAIYSDKKYCILTGFGITNEIREALDSGLILNYLSKPFDLNQIDTVITDALNLA